VDDRQSRLGDAIRVMRWLADRRTPFTVHDLVAGLGIHKRTAYRLLCALEGACLIEMESQAHVDAGSSGWWPSSWRSTVRMVTVGSRTRSAA
jgi:predicted DNA-binding transcriptional regulator YafY